MHSVYIRDFLAMASMNSQTLQNQRISSIAAYILRVL